MTGLYLILAIIVVIVLYKLLPKSGVKIKLTYDRWNSKFDKKFNIRDHPLYKNWSLGEER
jgi:hypothetical protein